MDAAVRTVLDGVQDVAVTALPDGSVDHRYRIVGRNGRHLSRDEFVEKLDADARTFLLEPLATEPGGMAVNAAIQLDALGVTTRLAGHLDHPVFDELAFETVSMGDPAHVHVYDFEGSATMLVEASTAIEQWTLHDLESALGDRTPAWLEADAVVCSNWSSVPNMTSVYEDLAAADVDGGWFVVDPGDVTIRPRHDVDAFVSALGALQESFDVVLNPNATEVAAIAEARGLDATSVPALLEEIRVDAGITAAVVHAVPEAAVATRTGSLRVPNYDTRGPVRFTGAGDRFTGGLAASLATGANWDVALRLANACATHYVGSGETATGDSLRSFPSVSSPDRTP